MTTQFDGIYHGLSPEVGSGCCSMGAGSVDLLSLTHLNRISDRPERGGLEGRREREGHVGTRDRHQVGSVVTRRSELPDQSGLEGRHSVRL